MTDKLTLAGKLAAKSRPYCFLAGALIDAKPAFFTVCLKNKDMKPYSRFVLELLTDGNAKRMLGQPENPAGKAIRKNLYQIDPFADNPEADIEPMLAAMLMLWDKDDDLNRAVRKIENCSLKLKRKGRSF